MRLRIMVRTSSTPPGFPDIDDAMSLFFMQAMLLTTLDDMCEKLSPMQPGALAGARQAPKEGLSAKLAANAADLVVESVLRTRAVIRTSTLSGGQKAGLLAGIAAMIHSVGEEALALELVCEAGRIGWVHPRAIRIVLGPCRRRRAPQECC